MSSTLNSNRALAYVFVLCAVATFVLLSAHPAGGGHSFVEILQVEARDQVKDGVVHGGFILISAILIVCLAVLSRILGPERVSVTVGFVAFGIGAAALMMSMGLDGLVVPAVAARCLREGTAQSLASGQTLLLFCGACIKILMPTGLLFEGAAMLSYSVAMFARRWVWAGGFGVGDCRADRAFAVVRLGAAFPHSGDCGSVRVVSVRCGSAMVGEFTCGDLIQTCAGPPRP